LNLEFIIEKGGMMSNVRQILQVKGNTIVWSVKPDNTVYEALRIMADKDVGALLVMEGEKLVGIISERDYARKVILLGKASKDTLVKDIMSSTVFVIHPSQTSEEAMELMNSKHIRHLPVVDDSHSVVGVISISDVLRDIIYRQREKIKQISEETK
jgi:CBS domain-containing protein